MRHLVTGAGSGIGGAVARRLLARGDELVLLARSEDRAEDLAAAFPGALARVADLADPAAVSALDVGVETLDSLVHAAGVVDLGRVADASAASWRSQLDVNLVAPALLTARCLPALRAGLGTVVFVNSGSGIQPGPGWSAYGASKAGLRALADVLRAEEAEHGVRVTTVFPGRTATPMQAQVHAQERQPYDADRWIRPETVADLIVSVLDLGPDAALHEAVLRPTP